MKTIKVTELAKKNEMPLVSIYMPTHVGVESQQDPIRLKNLLKEVEEKFKNNEDIDLDSKEFFGQAYDLLDDNEFWSENTSGLALLIDSDDTYVYRLNGKVQEKTHIGEYFNVFPLINYYELPNDYYFLDLSKDRFALYSYKDGKLNEQDPEIISKFTDLFTDRDLETEGSPTRGSADSFHSYHTASSVEEKERDKYFRYLADELKTFLHDKDSNLILFGTSDNIAEFKDMIDFDVYATIDKPFSSIDKTDLYGVLRENLLPKYVKNMDEKIDGLRTEIGQDRGSDDLYRIMIDAQKGKIDTLYLSSDIDQDEELNRLISNVYTAAGNVVIVDAEHNNFPEDGGATYRY